MEAGNQNRLSKLFVLQIRLSDLLWHTKVEKLLVSLLSNLPVDILLLLASSVSYSCRICWHWWVVVVDAVVKIVEVVAIGETVTGPKDVAFMMLQSKLLLSYLLVFAGIAIAVAVIVAVRTISQYFKAIKARNLPVVSGSYGYCLCFYLLSL